MTHSTTEGWYLGCYIKQVELQDQDQVQPLVPCARRCPGLIINQRSHILIPNGSLECPCLYTRELSGTKKRQSLYVFRIERHKRMHCVYLFQY